MFGMNCAALDKKSFDVFPLSSFGNVKSEIKKYEFDK